MRAAVLHAPGPPEAFAIEPRPVPRPAGDDVLVEVAACGVSFRDVVERNGTYRRDVTFPRVIGLEIAGTVLEAGPLAHRLRPGDRVCSKAFTSCGQCRLCRTGREATCAKRRPVHGGYAEYVCLPEDAFSVVPASLSFEQACSLGPAAGVALNAVRDVARVALGESVLVTGATGGVGYASLQLAKRAGARVIAVTRSPDKIPMLREAGADEVALLDDGTALVDAVRAFTGGEGVDVVIDNVGSRVFHACFDALARHGRYAMVGQLYGDEIAINPARIFFKRAQLLGVGSVSRAQVDDAVRLAAAGGLAVRIDTVLPLERVADAHRRVEQGHAAGRVVLSPLLKETQ